VKISKLAALLSVAAVLGMAAPSIADDSSSGVNMAVQGALIVPRLGGVVCGTVIGTPVAILRETYKSYTTWTPAMADKIGGKDCAPACLAVSLASLPASMVWGTASGTFYGCKNGIVKGFTEPFNIDSFSLGKNCEE
jgi:hypothetical protein